MHKIHSAIKTPDSSLEIWRYMDLWKFLDILDNSRLFLSQAQQFEDKLDGRIPSNKLKSAPGFHPLKKLDKFADTSLRRCNYVNCWSSEINETYPLWKVYSDYRTAVAIKTTIGDLINSVSDATEQIYIGKVKYVDPNRTYKFGGNTFQFFFEKRNYFSFENEVRILVNLNYKDDTELLKLPPGIFVQVNPQFLIKEIKLAPLADESFKKLIELKLKDMNLKIPVVFSEI